MFFDFSMHTLIDLPYFPPIAYFSVCLLSETLTIDVCEYYEKQSYRNRCYINTSQGVLPLSVPILHSKDKKQIIKDIKIDYKENWVNIHWRSIVSAYRKSPFFEFYADFFREILYKKTIFLLDLNLEILNTCLRFLGLNKNLVITQKYVEKKENLSYTDLRSFIHPKKKDNALVFYQAKPYVQVFGSKFEDNLSIIDLLFCEGSNALALLKASTKEQNHPIISL